MKRTLGTLGLCAVVAITAGTAGAQSAGGPYTMRKQVIAGGGSRASAGLYVATVTIAEATASAPQNGGSYWLTGGFHGSSAPRSPQIFCDGFEATPCP